VDLVVPLLQLIEQLGLYLVLLGNDRAVYLAELYAQGQVLSGLRAFD